MREIGTVDDDDSIGRERDGGLRGLLDPPQQLRQLRRHCAESHDGERVHWYESCCFSDDFPVSGAAQAIRARGSQSVAASALEAVVGWTGTVAGRCNLT